MKMMDMSGHDQAAMSHEMMQNGNSAAHQDMAEMHKKMMKAKPEAACSKAVLTGMCYSVGIAEANSPARFIGQSAMTSGHAE
jgi:hypothetical protein